MPTRNIARINTLLDTESQEYVSNISTLIRQSENEAFDLPNNLLVVSFMLDYVSESVLNNNPNLEVMNQALDFITVNNYIL
jgi:hypothetical protein